MKRKWSVGLILVMVLLSLSVTAVAAVIANHVFEQVIDMEVANGPFCTWRYEDRLRLVELLAESGWEFPLEKLRALHEESTAPEDKEALVTALITDAFGREDAVSHFAILERVKGPMTTWSLEDKAWYTQYIRAKLDVLDPWQDLLPEEDDLTAEEAVRIAREAILRAHQTEALQSARDQMVEDLQTMVTDVSFFTNGEDTETRWLIRFLRDPYENAEYSVLLTRGGEVTEDERLFVYTPEHEIARRSQASEATELDLLEAEKGPAATWSLADKTALLGEENGLPAEGEISEEEALRIATETLASLDVDPAPYTACVWYKRYDPYDSNRQEPFYAVYFIDNLDAPMDSYCVLIDPQSGTVLETTASASDSLG